jgi:hypothetical protein
MTYQLVGNQLTISTTLAPFDDNILDGFVLPTTGTVQPDGSVRSNDPNFPWFIGSSAVQNGFPWLFTTSTQPVQPPLVFKTNWKGSGTWSINIDRKDLLVGPNTMSIWIKNGDDTRMGVYGGDLVLISDNFTITK